MKPIDADLLEFWGNLLLNAARSQRAGQALADWMQQGFNAMGEYTAQFQRACGLTHPNNDSRGATGDDNAWQQAMESHQHAFLQFLKLLDVVPRSTHQALQKHYDKLQTEMMQCKATVARLESQLAKSGADQTHAAISAEFAQLVDKQARQFTQLLESYGKMVKDPKK